MTIHFPVNFEKEGKTHSHSNLNKYQIRTTRMLLVAYADVPSAPLLNSPKNSPVLIQSLNLTYFYTRCARGFLELAVAIIITRWKRRKHSEFMLAYWLLNKACIMYKYWKYIFELRHISPVLIAEERRAFKKAEKIIKSRKWICDFTMNIFPPNFPFSLPLYSIKPKNFALPSEFDLHWPGESSLIETFFYCIINEKWHCNERGW